MANFRDMEIKDDSERKSIPKATIDVPSMLKEQGFDLVDISDSGSLIVRTPDGSEGEVDVNGMVNDLLSKQGVDPTQYDLDIQINDPKTAFAKAAVDVEDRAKLSVGNTKGKLGYLANKFGKENVALDEEKGLVVKKNGAWMQVDPSGLNQYIDDPWELTRDLADLLDIGVNIAGTTYSAGKGAIGGSLVAPGPGTIVGGLVGAGLGGGASGGIRTLLGKAVGTYDATDDEMLKDIALESLLSMGGQAVGYGVKPTLGVIGKGLSKLKNSADDATKSVISGAYGQLTGAGQEAMETVIERPGEWSAALKQYSKNVKNGSEIAAKAFDDGVANTEQLLDIAVKKLPQKYASLMDDLSKSANISKLSVNTDDILNGAAKSLEESGFGKVVTEGDNVIFKPYSQSEFVMRQSQGLPTELLDDTAVKEINSIVKTLSGFGGNKISGKAAANTLIGMNRTLNQLSRDALKGSVAPATERAISNVSAAYKNGVREAFNNADLALEYKAMQDIYSQYGDFVNMARSALKNRSPEALDNIFKRISSSSIKSRGTKRAVNELVDLVGEEGSELLSKIAINHAVSKTAEWAPRMGLVSGVALGSTLAGGASVGLGGGAAALTQSSPRFVANQLAAGAQAMKAIGAGTKAVANPLIKYGLSTVDMLKSLSPAAMNELLRNSNLMQSVIMAPIQATQGEVEDTQLMNQYIQDSLNKAQ